MCMSSTCDAHTCALVLVWLQGLQNTEDDGRLAFQLQCHFKEEDEQTMARKEDLCRTRFNQGHLSRSGGFGASCWMT